MRKNTSLTLTFAAAALCTAGSAYAAIDIVSPLVPDPFAAVPATDQWTTIAVGGATDATLLTGPDLDSKVIPTTDISTIITVLGSSPTIPPSANAIARQNTGLNNGGITFLQTRATAEDYILLLGHLSNATGANLNSVQIQYEYSKATAANAFSETIKGLRAYWSTTGLPNSWTMIPEFSRDTDGAYNAPDIVNKTIALPAPLAPGASFYLLFADQNSAGEDSSYHIRNFAAGPGLPLDIQGVVSTPVRNPGVNISDPSDDFATFTITTTGTGAVGAGWRIAAGPLTGTTGAYGATQSFTVPIGDFTAGPVTVKIEDQANTQAYFQRAIPAPPVVYAVTATNSPKITFSPPAVGAGSYTPPLLAPVEPGFRGGADGAITNSNVQTQPSPGPTTNQYFHITTNMSLVTDAVDVSALKGSLLKGDIDLSFYATSGTGLDAADSLNFRIEVAQDGNFTNTAAGNIITANIKDVPVGTATAFGESIAAIAHPGEVNPAPFPTTDFIFHNFSTNVLIPATASKPLARIVAQSIAGVSNTEHVLVDNITFSSNTAPTLSASAGTATWNNNGTVTAADDSFSIPVTVLGFNLGASPGWTSDETPARTGLYATPNPVIFGPFTDRTPKTVQLTDQGNPAIKSDTFTLSPPPATLTAALVAGSIARDETTPGVADDTVTFKLNINGANLSPSFTATIPFVPTTITGAGNYPVGGGEMTFTLHNVPIAASTINVVIADAGYPASTQTIAIAIPAPTTPPALVIGQKDFGGGLSDVVATTIAPEWIPFAGRQLVMTTGIAADSPVDSEVLDVSAVGDVHFSAKFRAHETSAGSGFEPGDKFKAELIIDGTPVSLITALDVGDGAGATIAPGANGAPNGYLNGYSGAAGLDLVNNTVTYANAAEDYNANRNRDELNGSGAAVADSADHTFNLSYTIPASAVNVQLKIYGAGISGSEAFTVSDVLFTTSTPPGGDADGDGVSDAFEAIMGTSPSDPNDVLRLSLNVANPTQVGFPTKPSKFYRVYASDDTNGQEATHLLVWKDAGLATITGDGTVKQFNVTTAPGEPRRFYRLHVMGTDGPWPATAP